MTDISEETLTRRATDNGAARVTLAALEANIKSENYFNAAEAAGANPGTPVPEELKLLSFCVLTLRNGFVVVGQSACADPANYNAEIGWQIARNDAVRQIWPLMGYELRSKLNTIAKIKDQDLGEALTRLTAHQLGNPAAFRPRDGDAILAYIETTNGDSDNG